MLLLLLLVLAIHAGAATMSRRLFDEGGPKCIDGSPAGFYADAPLNEATKVIVWLQGGGICETLADCRVRANSDLGSSKHWAETREPTNGLMETNKTINPDFNDFVHIFVPYCSGDVWTGTRASATNPFPEAPSSAWSGYFQGHIVLQSVIDAIEAESSRNISEFVLTGCSAGGIGTFGNCDYAASRFPDAKVRCRPEAGYFGLPIMSYADFVKEGPLPSDADLHKFSKTSWVDNVEPHIVHEPAYAKCVANATFRPDDHCPESLREKCCKSVPYLYPFIETPIFVSENTVDSYQVYTQNGCPRLPTKNTIAYVDYLHGILAGSLYDVVVNGSGRGRNGLFAPACLDHCMQWQGNAAASIGGKTPQSAFGDWYYGRRTDSNMRIDNSTALSQLLGCASEHA